MHHAAAVREREGLAARLLAIDTDVKGIIESLRERGFRSPYLRNYVVARINPVRFHRAKKGETKPPMTLAAARALSSHSKLSAAGIASEALKIASGIDIYTNDYITVEEL